MKKFTQHFTESKKNIIAGLEYMSNKLNPEGKVYYGIVEMELNGVGAYTQYFKLPKLLPYNAVFITDGAFMIPGQKPDYVDYKAKILITDKKIMDAFVLDKYASRRNEPLNSFIKKLYEGLNITGGVYPNLP